MRSQFILIILFVFCSFSFTDCSQSEQPSQTEPEIETMMFASMQDGQVEKIYLSDNTCCSTSISHLHEIEEYDSTYSFIDFPFDSKSADLLLLKKAQAQLGKKIVFGVYQKGPGDVELVRVDNSSGDINYYETFGHWTKMVLGCNGRENIKVNFFELKKESLDSKPNSKKMPPRIFK